MKLIPQTRVTVTKEGQNYTFPDCGERTLMNFFKYLLFDIKEGYITKENLEQFNGKYQGNLLKEIFNAGLIIYVNDLEQTEYLTNKKDKFATLLTKYPNKEIFHRGFCELKPSSENVFKMIYFLLHGEENVDESTPAFILDLLVAFGKDGEFKDNNNTLIIDQDIKITFNINHGDLSFLKYNESELYFENTKLILLIWLPKSKYSCLKSL